MLIKPHEQFNIWDASLTIPILALDIVIFTIYHSKLCIIVSKPLESDNQGYAIPGGIVARGHNLEENFDDILARKTGITGVYKEQLYTFGDPYRDPRGHVVAVCYYALVSIDSFLTKVDFTKVDIIDYDDLDKTHFLYDHRNIIEYAKQRLEWKFEYTNIMSQILPEKFRISELQKVYEIIHGKTYDKRNFQKKIFALDLIEETNERDTSMNRPAKLYRFREKELKIIGD